MKLRLISIISLLYTSVVSATGIPVFDGANAINAVAQITHMMTQVKHLEEQISQAEKEFSSMSGNRGLGGLIGSEYDNNMNDVDAQQIMSNYGIKDSSYYKLDSGSGDLYNLQNQSAAFWEGRSQKFRNQAEGRFNELQRLVNKVNDSPDPKDIMDLQARIQAEGTMLQNELVKLQMMHSQAQAQQVMIKQKQVEEHFKASRRSQTPLTVNIGE